MATFNYEQFQCCFLNWINQQQEDLEELVQALETNPGNEKLQILTEKGIKHFEEYYEKRARMSEHDAPSFLSHSWCTSFENAFLWIGGCRPSLSIRLVYSVCGSEVDAQLVEFLRGEIKGNLAEISALQLHSINSLHGNTVREEDKLSNTMASLQANGYSSFFAHFHFEDIADEPLAMIAKRACRVGQSGLDLDQAIDAHSHSLARVLAAADKLRLNTLKELMRILSPLQAVDLLVATKKLHLSMHEWGKRRDKQIGKT
ncbi:delay of germination 1 [Forsythia ovata]|uniref:Delay of germination 1 n=1 Tax=Forsythia ovata TaxID=205694 RepID=A0ABD1S7P7_9LAMI